MCALVTGVQTCALPICDSQAVFVPWRYECGSLLTTSNHSFVKWAKRAPIDGHRHPRSTAASQQGSHPPGRSRLRDRKSVVQGTSVSVRVDLGGRRIITNKQETSIKKPPPNQPHT